MNIPRLRGLLATACAVAPLALSGSASAAGFYVQEQSVRGLGRAYSGEAADIGPDSLWWNPASIAGVEGKQIYTGLQVVTVGAKVVDQGSTIQRPGQPAASVGGATDQHNPAKQGFVPNLAAAWRLSDQWAVGLAVTAPFDFTTKYGADSWTRYGARTSRLLDLDIQPTAAWRPTRWLDVGVGFDAQYMDAELTSALPNLSPLLADGNSTLTGSGWNYGWDVGAQARPNARLTVGASYRSAIHHKLNGQVSASGLQGPLAGANFSVPGVAHITTPWIATLGARWRANARWTLNVQVQRFGWSAFKAIDVSYAGTSSSTPENYHDTTTAAIGAEYAYSPKVTLRGGVQYDPTPTPDVGRSARVPDANRMIYGLGASYAPTPRVAFDVGAAYIQFQHSHIDTNATAYAGTAAVTPVSLTGAVSGGGVVLSGGAKLSF